MALSTANFLKLADRLAAQYGELLSWEDTVNAVGTNGKYSTTVTGTGDIVAETYLADPAYVLDNDATATYLFTYAPFWSNFISALRKYFTAVGQTDLIDGYLTANGIRVHENFDAVHYIAVGTHLSGSNVFSGTVSDVAQIDLSNVGTATATLQPVGAKATATITAGADTALAYTAVAAGVSGNAISLQYIDPAAPSQSLYVEVQGQKIKVHLATDGSSNVTSTAGDVRTAVNAHGEAAALVSISAPGSTTGTVAAVPETYLTNRNTSLTYTARTTGSEGNEVSVAYTDPGALTASTTSSASGSAITVTLAHDGTDIVATAQDVKTAVESDSASNALVSIVANGTITGVVSAVSPTYLDGGCTAPLTSSSPLGTGVSAASPTNRAAQGFKVVLTPASRASSLTVYPANSHAFLDIDPAGSNNAVRFRAVAAGTSGNNITVQYEYTQVPSTSGAVSVVGNAIKITLATDASSAITTTGSGIVSLISGSAGASALVTATSLDAGSGAVTAFPAAHLDNTRTKVNLVAVAAGASGDSVSITYSDPGASGQSESVSVVGNAITVHLATDGSSNVTSTPSTIVSTINGNGPASSLVTASLTDPTKADGPVAAVSQTYLDGGSGPNLLRDVRLTLNLLKSDLTNVSRVVGFSAGSTPSAEVAIGAQDATLITGSQGGYNAILYTAVAAGVSGNDITISYVNPGTVDSPLSVTVVGNAITVHLATDHAGSPSSTADSVETAVNGNGPASALVTASVRGFGHGLVSAQSPTNLSGGFAAERFFKVNSATVSGGEYQDRFVVQSVVERTITL